MRALTVASATFTPLGGPNEAARRNDFDEGWRQSDVDPTSNKPATKSVASSATAVATLV